jgi:thiamine biosynthesis lipoprotein
MEFYTFRAMNSAIVMAADGRTDEVRFGFQTARNFIETCEKRFSRFLDTSELSHLNRSQGQWFLASTDLFELIKLSRQFYERTSGLFDPTILTDLKRVGYDRSMDELRKLNLISNTDGQAEPGERLRERFYFGMVQMDDELSSIWLPEGLEIDLGGIAKGWIAEKAALQLARFSTACTVSAGGDMVLVGTPDELDYWEIELEDPRNPAQALTMLNLGPGAVATSSIVKRSWRQGEKLRHHLIDPRTGDPAETDWLSVTVIADRAVAAEVFAKALLIAGSRQAMELFSRNQEISFIAVDRDGKLWGSQNSMEFFNDPQ